MSMTTNHLTYSEIAYSEIENIIDYHMNIDRDFMFVCNGDLASFISGYMEHKYGLEDDTSNLFDGKINKEFYVSVHFGDEDTLFFCEDARGYSEYKLSDLEECSYYISADVNMSYAEMHEKLCADEGVWMKFRLFEEEEEYCCNQQCDCCDQCDENISDEMDNEDTGRKISLDEFLDIYTERVQDVSGCTSCVKMVLEEMIEEVLEGVLDSL